MKIKKIMVTYVIEVSEPIELERIAQLIGIGIFPSLEFMRDRMPITIDVKEVGRTISWSQD